MSGEGLAEAADDATATTTETRKSFKPGEKVLSPKRRLQEQALAKKDAEQACVHAWCIVHRKVAALCLITSYSFREYLLAGEASGSKGGVLMALMMLSTR